MNYALGCNVLTICGTFIGAYLGKRLTEYLIFKPTSYYDCLFFYNQGFESSISFNYLKFFIDFVNEAKISLDICFFLITDSKVITAIIEAKKRNVKIRIVTDYEKGIVDNHVARRLFKAGLRVNFDVCDPTKSLMHHKFCIRDSKSVLLCSINLTEAASVGSYDNVLITNDPEFVDPFKIHFNELLASFL